MNRRQKLKQRAEILVVMSFALLMGTGLLGVVYWSTGLPVVQKDVSGNCVRVVVLDEHDRPLERDCSTIDLARDRYHVTYIIDDPQVPPVRSESDIEIAAAD